MTSIAFGYGCFTHPVRGSSQRPGDKKPNAEHRHTASRHKAHRPVAPLQLYGEPTPVYMGLHRVPILAIKCILQPVGDNFVFLSLLFPRTLARARFLGRKSAFKKNLIPPYHSPKTNFVGRMAHQCKPV